MTGATVQGVTPLYVSCLILAALYEGPLLPVSQYRLSTLLGQHGGLCNFCEYPKKTNHCKNDSYLFHFVLSCHFFVQLYMTRKLNIGDDSEFCMN